MIYSSERRIDFIFSTCVLDWMELDYLREPLTLSGRGAHRPWNDTKIAILQQSPQISHYQEPVRPPEQFEDEPKRRRAKTVDDAAIARKVRLQGLQNKVKRHRHHAKAVFVSFLKIDPMTQVQIAKLPEFLTIQEVIKVLNISVPQFRKIWHLNPILSDYLNLGDPALKGYQCIQNGKVAKIYYHKNRIALLAWKERIGLEDK